MRSFRVADPKVLGQRFDFNLDLERGVYMRQPLDQLATLLTGIAQQVSSRHLAAHDVEALLGLGLGPLQTEVDGGLRGAEELREMGIQIVSVRMADMSPTAELEKALQTPTRERLQQEADRATFERRALAVERERAIAENELKNQIELARREESLIEQRGQNERRRAQEEAQSRHIEVEAQAERTRIEADAQAARIRTLESAQVEGERQRMQIYGALPSSVLMGLAARELAGKLQTISHLNVTPDLLGPALAALAEAGTQRLSGDG